MARLLVLVRHGKAQRRSPEREDLTRELTKAGKRSLRAFYPHALRMVRKVQGRTIEVWSSPAVRCAQTAQIAKKVLEERGAKLIGDIQTVDELGNQDIDGFLAAVGECPSDVVVAVGHNPFCGAVVERLTGARIEFTTGAMASVRMQNELGDDDARLLWYLQGPESQRWKTLCRMDKAFVQAAGRVQANKEAFDTDPIDPETTHQLRISIRTLRSLLTFARPYLKSGVYKQCQRDLRAIVLKFSRLRELDVFEKQLRGIDNCDPVLIEEVRQLRARECKSVVARMGKKNEVKRLGRVQRSVRHGMWRAAVEENGLSRDEVRSAFDLMVANVSAHLAELDAADAEEVHHVRKECKRMRYVAENLVDILGEDAPQIAKNMEKGQDDLGALCDARVNIGIIDELEGLDLPDAAKRNLADLRAHNEAVVDAALRRSLQEDSALL